MSSIGSKMAWDAACLGELVIDLVPHAQVDGEWLYAPSPGGAPGNVAVGLARLGRRSAMLSKTDDKVFGQLILRTLQAHGVDTSGIVADPETRMRLSVVAHGPDGERSFVFYRDNPADALIDFGGNWQDLVENCRVLHVGSLLMASPRAAAAQEKAISTARARGIPLSLDPNFRPSLWPSEAAMVGAGRHLLAKAQIVKLSREELAMLAGHGPVEEAVRSLWHPEMTHLAVTRGADGAELFTAGRRISCPGYAVAAVDTLAAGDAFMASLLAGLLEHGFETGDDRVLFNILRTACAAGALATTRKGAMTSMPDGAEIGRFLAASPQGVSQRP